MALLPLLLVVMTVGVGGVLGDEAGPARWFEAQDEALLGGQHRVFPPPADGFGPDGDFQHFQEQVVLEEGPVRNVTDADGPDADGGPRNRSRRFFPFLQAADDVVLLGNCTPGTVLLDKTLVVGPATSPQAQTFLFHQPLVFIKCVKLISRNPGFNGQMRVVNGGAGSDFVLVELRSLAWFRAVWRLVVQ
ncbi:hypothetical protein ONE63_003200 [Megalurothrips usitatus]|uniref:Secreted protein n=1 Tax=Megalurothrips usitatus TaxID=439358 RepID=A0AAV7XD51_9NEOP|nr:hypothetical protein ONE63_003200 [Megalurothrips usitatus]